MPIKKEVKMKMLLDPKHRKHSVVYRAKSKSSLIGSVYLKKVETLKVFEELPKEITITVTP